MPTHKENGKIIQLIRRRSKLEVESKQELRSAMINATLNSLLNTGKYRK